MNRQSPPVRAVLWLLALVSPLASCALSSSQAGGASALASEDSLRSEWRDAVAEQDVVRAAAMRQRLAAFQPEDLSRQLAVADSLREAGLPLAALRICRELGQHPEYRVNALRLEARVLADQGEALSAAERLEALAADDSIADDERRQYWQSAAELREEGGDLGGAVLNLEAAFEGQQISDSDQHLLDRLHAYQTGEFRRLEDAIGVLARHQNPEMRLAAALYLSRFDEQAAYLAQADALDDPSEAVVLTCLRHLLGSEELLARDAILPVLDHPSTEVRWLATRCLGRLGDKQDVAQIVRRLDADDRTLFRAQCVALERLSGQHFEAPLGADLEQRELIAEAWRAWWQQGD